MSSIHLSRNQAIAWLEKLSPENPLYSEIERGLMQGGFHYLSNGTKLYATPEDEKLLGGGIYELVLQQHDQIITMASTLFSIVFADKDRAIHGCKFIYQKLQQMIKNTETLVQQTSEEINENHQRIVQIEANKVAATKRLGTLNNEYNNLQAQLANLNSQKADLDRQKIEEQEKFHRTMTHPGKLMAIAVLSSVNRSNFDRMLRAYGVRIREVVQNSQAVENQIKGQQRLIDLKQSEITRLNMEKQALEQKTKHLGQLLVGQRNRIVFLKQVLQKFHFLSEDINQIKDFILSNEKELLEIEIPSFVEEMKKSQQSFQQIAPIR
jgi:hypothetical protein